tara:strand:+ start:252 stop:428 length:177 start_codon:yes stop_codon:yes gene_type:complete
MDGHSKDVEGIARNVGKNGITVEQLQALDNWPAHQGTEPVEIPFTAGRAIRDSRGQSH